MEPMSPHEAVNEYLADKRPEVTDSTYANHQHRLRVFLTWCDENGLENLNELRARDLHEFKKWRSEDVKPVTLKNQLGTVKLYLQFCERLDVAPKGIHQRLELPDIGRNEDVRSVLITSGEADAILDYCEKFEYATLRHAIFYLLWHTGMRSSSARALDLTDYHSDGGWLDIRHRPEQGTSLKNKERGERQVNLKDDVCRVLDDFVEMHHPLVEDDHGRVPLLGTANGRAHRTTLITNVYALTRPCHYSNECPHDRDPESCEAAQFDDASKCPSSVSPHAIRRGSITAHRNAKVPKDVASDRMDVSREVLDKHYDAGTPEEKRRRRMDFLDRM